MSNLESNNTQNFSNTPNVSNTIRKVNNTTPNVGIFNYNELSIKNKNNRDKEKTLNSLANFVKSQILENNFDLVVVCSQNSILRTTNHIQHIISETLEGTPYKLLSKMSINKKSIFNVFGKKINVRTRIWYNTNTINSPPNNFQVNMINNKNNREFKNIRSNNLEKMGIKLIQRQKIYPSDTQKIKEGIGVIFTKIIISENTNQKGGKNITPLQKLNVTTSREQKPNLITSIEQKPNVINYTKQNTNIITSREENPNVINYTQQNPNVIQQTINKKIHEFIIVNSNPPLLKQNELFSNNVSLDAISKTKKLNKNNINLIYISVNGIKYSKLDSTNSNLSYLDNNIYYYNLNAIIPIVNNKNKKFITTIITNKIKKTNNLSDGQNKKKKIFNLKVLTNSYGYLLNHKTLKKFNNKYKKSISNKK